MDFAVIDNNERPMVPDRGRGSGFVRALEGWTPGSDYEFVRYDRIATRLPDLLRCRGLILSGSKFDLARGDGSFDREVYRMMAPQLKLIRDFQGPVLGICFGHQLMALGDEYEESRSDFGHIRIRNMEVPQDRDRISKISLTRPLPFLDKTEIWVQFNHRQEVLLNAALRDCYDVVAGSDLCPVHVMQHRFRKWVGVQFHPELGKSPQAGDTGQEEAAIQDGRATLQGFVRYCLH